MLLAVSALTSSVVMFCLALGVALGLIFALCMTGIAGIAASAASADLGAPKLIARSSARTRPRPTGRHMLRRIWRLLLAGPVALCGGFSVGLAALSVLPVAEADRLAIAILIAILGSAALVAWTSSDPKLGRATVLGIGVLVTAAATSVAIPS